VCLFGCVCLARGKKTEYICALKVCNIYKYLYVLSLPLRQLLSSSPCSCVCLFRVRLLGEGKENQTHLRTQGTITPLSHHCSTTVTPL
jgi:hypothetical protein